jgi:hypothetical protein
MNRCLLMNPISAENTFSVSVSEKYVVRELLIVS